MLKTLLIDVKERNKSCESFLSFVFLTFLDAGNLDEYLIACKKGEGDWPLKSMQIEICNPIMSTEDLFARHAKSLP